MEGIFDLYVLELFVHSACRTYAHNTLFLPPLTGNKQFFCYPETANLTLEEVDWLFYEGDVVKRSRRVAKVGWESAEGVEPSPAVLETGSVASSRKGEEAEKREDVGR